jgi:heat shock protein HslJ
MKYLTLLVLITTLFACKNRNIQDSKKNDLEGADLFFIGLNDPGLDSFNLPPYKLNLLNGQYRLSLDVNSCSGTYKMKGSEIKFNDDLSCTKICCDGPYAQSFKEILKSTFIVKKEGENFILNKGDLQLLLSKTAPQKLSALIGKKYLVSKAFSMGKEYKPDFAMTMEFTASSFELQLNANACSGNCEISDDQIKFSNGTSCTEKCCDSELSLAIRSMFTGTMQYVIDEEHPVIFNKNSRIWLVPFKEGKKENSRVNADELIGKDFKILDVTILPQDNDSQKAITQKYSFDYILSFRSDGLGLKLDKNTCNTSATYNDNTIDIGSSMGCTKLCCDSKESVELKNYLKGKFYLKENGSEIIMSNDEISLRLLKF